MSEHTTTPDGRTLLSEATAETLRPSEREDGGFDEPECCAECFEDFRYDDCGGYNPPCSCSECGGQLCRPCCEAANAFSDDDDDDEEDMDDTPTTEREG